MKIKDLPKIERPREKLKKREKNNMPKVYIERSRSKIAMDSDFTFMTNRNESKIIIMDTPGVPLDILMK